MCDGEIGDPVTQPRSEGGGLVTMDQETRTHYLDAATDKHLTNGSPDPEPVDPLLVAQWSIENVTSWATCMEHFSRTLLDCLRQEAIDGEVLLSLTEEDVRDMRYKLGYKLTFGELKKFWIAVLKLQLLVKNSSAESVILGIECHGNGNSVYMPLASTGCGPPSSSTCPCPQAECPSYVSDCDTYLRMGGRYVPPEYFKTAMSLGEWSTTCPPSITKVNCPLIASAGLSVVCQFSRAFRFSLYSAVQAYTFLAIAEK